jgi:4-amino-4-deoxy-L-arabinose transferase-like glycosyltransferase
MEDSIPALDSASIAPSRRGRRLGSWLLLLIALILVRLPLTQGLELSDASAVMEQFALASTQETWLRQHRGEPHAWIVPSLFGQPRLAKPPLTVWLNLLAWRGLPIDAAPELLIWRARLVAVAMGLLMLGGVFWIGRTLWDAQTGFLATLAAGSMWFFQRQARIASYDIHMAAWVTLAVASAAWALRPFQLRPPRWKEATGWLLAGVFLAAGVMSKGPLALAVAGLGALAVAVVDRSVWRRAIVGCAAAAAFAAILVLPWYLYAWVSVPGAYGRWRAEYGIDVTPRPVYYYLSVLGLVLPWTLWLIGGFFQPFRAGGELRRRLLVPLIWFFLILLVFTIPQARRQRYILPIVPAAALLIAQVFREHQALADQGVIDRDAKRLWVPHWIGMMLASLAVFPLIACEPWLVQRKWMPEILLDYGGHAAVIGALTCAGLLGLALVGWWAHHRWKPMLAGLLTAAWAILLMLVFWQGYAAADHGDNGLRLEAVKLADMTGERPTVSLVGPDHNFLMDRAILFYARIIAPPVDAAELGGLASSSPRTAVIAERDEVNDAALRSADYTVIGTFKDGKQKYHRVWVTKPAR